MNFYHSPLWNFQACVNIVRNQNSLCVICLSLPVKFPTYNIFKHHRHHLPLNQRIHWRRHKLLTSPSPFTFGTLIGSTQKSKLMELVLWYDLVLILFATYILILNYKTYIYIMMIENCEIMVQRWSWSPKVWHLVMILKQGRVFHDS